MSALEELWFHGARAKPGDVVLDVGAGRGAATRIFSQAVGAQGRVFAIEPHPRVFRELEQVIQAESLANARALRWAVSDAAGFCDLSDLDDDENNTIRSAGHRETIRVETTTVDALVAELSLERVDFVKMNIEGAERLALCAMDSVLSTARAIVIACHDFVADLKSDEWFRTKAVVSEALVARGFSICTRETDARVFVRDYVYAQRR